MQATGAFCHRGINGEIRKIGGRKGKKIQTQRAKESSS